MKAKGEILSKYLKIVKEVKKVPRKFGSFKIKY